jgi:hypothetical protein
MATGFELFAQLDEVVNLAVEDDLLGAIFVADWLGASLDVDDGQPEMPQANLTVDEATLPVRAAMSQDVSHAS